MPRRESSAGTVATLAAFVPRAEQTMVDPLMALRGE
jgi:hypothetical protein